MHCKNCGKYNEDDSLFCMNCGTAMRQPQAEGGFKAPDYAQEGEYNVNRRKKFHMKWMVVLLVAVADAVLLILLLTGGRHNWESTVNMAFNAMKSGNFKQVMDISYPAEFKQVRLYESGMTEKEYIAYYVNRDSEEWYHWETAKSYNVVKSQKLDKDELEYLNSHYGNHFDTPYNFIKEAREVTIKIKTFDIRPATGDNYTFTRTYKVVKVRNAWYVLGLMDGSSWW